MRSHRGVALVLVLVVASVLIVFGTFMISQSTAGLSLVNNEHQFHVAAYAAQAGLARARYELGQNSSWSQGQNNQTVAALTNVRFNYTTEPTQDSSFSVDVTNNLHGAGPLTNASAGVNIPPGVVIPQDCVLLTATGRTHQNRYVKTLSQLVLINPGGEFNTAILTRGTCTFVTSDQTGVSGKPNPANLPRAGIIALTGPVDLLSNVTVAGAVALPGANPALLHLGFNCDVAGGLLPVPAVLPALAPKTPAGGLPDVTSPNVTQPGPLLPGVYGDVVLGSGQTLNLSPGEYVFRNITLGSTASMVGGANAATRVYFTGSVSMASDSQFVNPSDSAPNLQIIEAGVPAPGRLVNFSSAGNTTACTIFAPDCAVNLLSNTNIKGGVVSLNFTAVSNTSVVYDMSLSTPGTPCIEILYTAGN